MLIRGQRRKKQIPPGFIYSKGSMHLIEVEFGMPGQSSFCRMPEILRKRYSGFLNILLENNHRNHREEMEKHRENPVGYRSFLTP